MRFITALFQSAIGNEDLQERLCMQGTQQLCATIVIRVDGERQQIAQSRNGAKNAESGFAHTPTGDWLAQTDGPTISLVKWLTPA
jgi:hypothetical protein